MLNTSLEKFKNTLTSPKRLVVNPSLPNIAAVLDDFSIQSFSDTANIWQIDPRRPEIDLDFVNFDFLLVESAWSGNSARWRYMVTSKVGPKAPLIKLVEECKKRGIPTVFWNKEDPPHFDEFLQTASLFDFIFTSDAAMIPHYQAKVPHSQVDLLRFAAAPSIHTPARTTNYREGDIAFAGQYFAHKFPERRQQMETLFPPATRFGFSIFSRALGGDTRYQFPHPYDQNVKGSLPYEHMVEEYRRYKIFLNVNSVVTSKTMCARRVFELTAAKTAVVGTSSAAVRSVFNDDEVLLADNSQDILGIYTKLLHDEKYRRVVTQAAWRKTLSNHTYSHRVEQIQQAINGNSTDETFHLHLLLGTNADENVLAMQLRSLENQVYLFNEPVSVTVSLIGSGLPSTKEVSHLSSIKILSIDSIDLYGNAHIGFLAADVKIGKYYLNDLVLTLKQQNTMFVSKILVNGLGELRDYEESPTQSLPTHGWLMRPGNAQLALQVATRSIESNGANINLNGFECYRSDSFELTSLDINDKFSMTFN